jgi:hypothetical protein
MASGSLFAWMGCVGKAVELLLDAGGVGVATLVLVQLQCFQPRRAGLALLTKRSIWVTHSVQGVGDVVDVAEGAEQDEGLLIVVDGLAVTAGVVVDEAQTVQSGCFADGIVKAAMQGERGMAVAAGGGIVAEPGG